MINYKEELLKYEPILEVDEIEDSIHTNELQDMFDVLQHLAKKNNSNEIDHSFSNGKGKE